MSENRKPRLPLSPSMRHSTPIPDAGPMVALASAGDPGTDVWVHRDHVESLRPCDESSCFVVMVSGRSHYVLGTPTEVARLLWPRGLGCWYAEVQAEDENGYLTACELRLPYHQIAAVTVTGATLRVQSSTGDWYVVRHVKDQKHASKWASEIARVQNEHLDDDRQDTRDYLYNRLVHAGVLENDPDPDDE